jgi:predicted DNA-binding ribbon-helix-helix protein
VYIDTPFAETEAMKSLVIKRSIVLADRKTSVSLEDAFWKCLREIAHERDETLSHLVSAIDASRQNANLSSSLRVFLSSIKVDLLCEAVRRSSSGRFLFSKPSF